jgi:hypothetical protein
VTVVVFDTWMMSLAVPAFSLNPSMWVGSKVMSAMSFRPTRSASTW